MDNVDKIKAAISAVLGWLTALWGWFGWTLVAWVALMGIDYLTGSAAAIKSGEWSSKVAREGILHKAGSVATVTVAGILDLVVGQLTSAAPGMLPFTYTTLLCPLVLIWYILTEAGSIVENVGRMGARIPGWLRKAIALFKGHVDEAGDELGAEPPEADKENE